MTTPLSFAVIGHPVAHSRSPEIHAAFAEQFGINLTYERIDAKPEAFEVRAQQFFNQGGAGLNVTVPFKERAWQLAQAHLSPRARDAGAVNTLWITNDCIHGCNTDGVGLVTDLRRLNMPLESARIIILGAGGAARGVLGPLLAAGAAHITVLNRTAQRAHELIDAWVLTHLNDRSKLLSGGFEGDTAWPTPDLVINATSSSLQGQALALPAALWASNACAYDMMYSAQPTTFMQQAQEAGSRQL
ncbi:MAG TPA: shikimate dehydrogenase, partial [Orrella sp.]